MDSQRNILLIALALVSFLLYNNWQSAKNPTQSPISQTVSNNLDSASADFNELDPLATPNNTQQALVKDAQIISIKTDVLELQINSVGGDIIKASLNQYAQSLNSVDKFVLLENSKTHKFFAQSGLIGPQGIDLSNTNRPQYTTSADSYELAGDQNELHVPLNYSLNGIDYTKTYILKRGSYAVDLTYQITNNSGSNASVGMYAHLRQTIVDGGSSITMPTYLGGAYSTQNVNYEKYSFNKMQERNLSLNLADGQGWAAMIQHYFAAAWIPRNAPNATLYSRIVADNAADIGVRLPNQDIATGDNATFTSTLWVGPKLQDEMAEVAPNLALVVDYGWLWFIAKPLHMLLSLIHSLIGNWGIAIIALTFIVRGVMYPLTKAQYTSMAKMRMLQPKILTMRERFGEDRQRMSQEMMKLYKEEKVNPLGGCLPILLQMPIFIALYWALMESVELRHSPFFAWINDLSSPDPYYILPLLMGASMFLIQKMSPATVTDPMQQKIMTFMPVIFTAFFLWFPSGLVLYWLVSNIVTLIQQTMIFKALEKKGLHTKS